jgi:c-di-GMP-binding flagellar brake protein YcgR
VVRIVSRGENDLEVGLRFVEIDPDDRESIIVFCFAEQRRQLRDKVEVAGLNEEEM